MSWTDSDGLERGGACNECGEPVEEEHHAYCADCYAEPQGWNRSDRTSPDALHWQREDRDRVVTARLLERIDDLERRVEQLERDAGRKAA